MMDTPVIALCRQLRQEMRFRLYLLRESRRRARHLRGFAQMNYLHRRVREVGWLQKLWRKVA